MSYVHGYDVRESQRLNDQAESLAELLHHDTAYPSGSRVLEAGCGVGAQTVALARNSAGAHIVAIDISGKSLEEAKRRTAQFTNVDLQKADIFDAPFEAESFDHIFVSFVLEHVPQPLAALVALKPLVKRGGTVTVIEGDHGSTFFYPESDAARDAIAALVELQRRAGGNAMIGRELFPLLTEAGFRDVRVSPRMVYVDASLPNLVDGFTRKTFTAMVEGVRDDAIRAGIITAARFDAGVRALHRAAEADGVFCYTFFKAVAVR